MDALELRCARCGRTMDIVRYRCADCGLTAEGQFRLPPLGRLTMEEQAFVTAFVRVHGNIRKMESLFGISYPTVKNRLNAIGRKLDSAMRTPDDPARVLDRLARGEITVNEALEMLPEP